MSKANTDGYWPCACVKRNRAGNMTHIKLNHPLLKSCAKCKAKRPPAGWNSSRGVK